MLPRTRARTWVFSFKIGHRLEIGRGLGKEKYPNNIFAGYYELCERVPYPVDHVNPVKTAVSLSAFGFRQDQQD
jgi:hypothetical protein